MDTPRGFTFVRRFIDLFICSFVALLLGVAAFAAFFAMDVTVTATGTLEPASCREVRAQMTGVEDRVNVDETGWPTAGANSGWRRCQRRWLSA